MGSETNEPFFFLLIYLIDSIIERKVFCFFKFPHFFFFRINQIYFAAQITLKIPTCSHWVTTLRLRFLASPLPFKRNMLLHKTSVPDITVPYSQHITQHEEVWRSIKQRGPLLRQTSLRQLRAAQSKSMHNSCSFTQPPTSLSWVNLTFPAAHSGMKESNTLYWNTLVVCDMHPLNHTLQTCTLMDLVTLLRAACDLRRV